MGFGQNLGWEMGFIPPFRTLKHCFLASKTIIPSHVTYKHTNNKQCYLHRMFSSNNETPLEDVFYVIPKHITCNDVISSNWHYRDTNTEINGIRDILVIN